MLLSIVTKKGGYKEFTYLNARQNCGDQKPRPLRGVLKTSNLDGVKSLAMYKGKKMPITKKKNSNTDNYNRWMDIGYDTDKD